MSDCCFNAKWALFQPYYGKNKIHPNEMMIMMTTLYLTNMLSWTFLELDHWHNSLWVYMSNSDTLSCFQANQFLLLLLKCCMLSGEAANTNIIVFGLTSQGLESMIYRFGINA